jgi:hypothetical protein
MVFKRAGQVQEWLADVSEDEFLEEDKTKLAVYKAFQEAVEASLDLVAMMCRIWRAGLSPSERRWRGGWKRCCRPGRKRVAVSGRALLGEEGFRSAALRLLGAGRCRAG